MQVVNAVCGMWWSNCFGLLSPVIDVCPTRKLVFQATSLAQSELGPEFGHQLHSQAIHNPGFASLPRYSSAATGNTVYASAQS